MKNQFIILTIETYFLNKKQDYILYIIDLTSHILPNTIKDGFSGILLNSEFDKHIYICSSCPTGLFRVGDKIVFKYEKYGLKNFWVGKFMRNGGGVEKDTLIFLKNSPEFIDIWEMKRSGDE